MGRPKVDLNGCVIEEPGLHGAQPSGTQGNLALVHSVSLAKLECAHAIPFPPNPRGKVQWGLVSLEST
jgi:hypothetical protein